MLTRLGNFLLFALFLLSLITCNACPTSAQSSPSNPPKTTEAAAPPGDVPSAFPSIDFATLTALDALASQVVHKLPKHTGKILVLDFTATTGTHGQLGEWLGDQFALALVRKDPKLQFLNRAELMPKIRTADFSYVGSKGNFNPKPQAGALCKQTGADTTVIGTYGAAENGVGLSVGLGCLSSKDAFKFDLNSPRIKLALTPGISTLLGNSLAALRPPDGIYAPGEGGVTIPECLQCPPPRNPLKPSSLTTSGVVYFTAVVSARGEISDLKLVQSAGSELDSAAVSTVRSWRFSPAVDIDGKPVVVRTLIEVSFNSF